MGTEALVNRMKTTVEFRSRTFPPYEKEEEQINPGRYGRRLAEFVATGLRSHGFETGELVAEDWGWLVPIKNRNCKLWVGCGNYEEYPDGFLCFIEPHTPFIRKFFRKIDIRSRIEALHRALDAVLAENIGVRDKRWWTHEEFNDQARARQSK